MQPSESSESLSWFRIWVKALVKPSATTFQSLIRDPRAGRRRAYTWIILSAFLGYIIWLIEGTTSRVIGGSFVDHLLYTLYAPAFALLAVIVITIFVGVAQFIARRMGGSGSFSELIYLTAAYFAPLLLITCALSIGGFIFHLAFFFLLPALVIFSVIGIKAVNQFGWVQAIASVFGGMMTFTFAICALTICISTTIFGIPFCAFLGGC